MEFQVYEEESYEPFQRAEINAAASDRKDQGEEKVETELKLRCCWCQEEEEGAQVWPFPKARH